MTPRDPLSRVLAAAEPIIAGEAMFKALDDDSVVYLTVRDLRALSAACDDLRALVGEVEGLRAVSLIAAPGPYSYEEEDYTGEMVRGTDGQLIAHVIGDSAETQYRAMLIARSVNLVRKILGSTEG